MNFQSWIYDRGGVPRRAHLGAARVVVDGVGVLPGQALQVGVRPEHQVLAPRHPPPLPHPTTVLAEGSCLGHRKTELHPLDNHLNVVGVVEVAGLKYWLVKWIPAPQLNEAPGGWSRHLQQETERVPTKQWLVERVEDPVRDALDRLHRPTVRHDAP